MIKDQTISAIMWISLTSNVFLLMLGYFVITGKIERTPVDYLSAMTAADRPTKTLSLK